MRTLLANLVAAALFTAACSDTTPAHLTCGPGTHERDRRCVPGAGLTCGPGTHAEGALCVLDAAAVTCGAGTHLADGACAPDAAVTCGSGTHADGGQCLLDAVPLACGPRTHAQGGACLPDLACGAGTHADAGRCVPDASLTCGPGTLLDGTLCIPATTSMTCGAGTHRVDDACLPDTILTCGPGTHVDGTLCVLDAEPLACGPGTTVVGSACLPDLTCGPGTHAAAGLCVPDSTLTCGSGTHVEAGQCVLDAAPITCGTGTHLAGDACVPDSTLSCGPGTHVEGTTCVLDATPISCGSGTRAEGTTCVPSGAYYDLRPLLTELPADGHTVVEVLALGRRADGTPATDDVVVIADRPTAGTFPAAFTLGPMGTYLYFTPCSAAAPDCLGPVRFLLVRASDPSVVLASTPVLQLVAPTGVGTAAPCLVGGNVLFMDGHDGWVMWWIDTIRVAGFSQRYIKPGESQIRWIFLETRPMNPRQGEYWFTEFVAPTGETFLPGIYDNPTAALDLARFDVSGNGAACQVVSSRFQIHELAVADGALQRFTATFEQRCRGGGPIYGCIHYELP